jgi:hypothetical protein
MLIYHTTFDKIQPSKSIQLTSIRTYNTLPILRTKVILHWHINQQIMRLPSLTTLIGDEIQGDLKWSSFVDGKNGFFYGIPSNARRVVKFNPLDKSLTEIGPDLGEGEFKWLCGARANTGDIYCAPCNANHILKIKTSDGTVETLNDVELPETGEYLWASGALATDSNIYYMPSCARGIMRLNPYNDSLSSVGDDLGQGEFKYSGTVVGIDDLVYGIPDRSKRIIKFDLTIPDTTSTVGEEATEWFGCDNGVLSGDGYIYAANMHGQVLQIDATSNNYTWIGDPICSGWGQGWVKQLLELISDTTSSDYTWIGDRIYSRRGGWGDAIIGVDKCIYWPPFNVNRVLKFDPETQQLPSLVGDDLGEGRDKWQGGALATDGVIYCIPFGHTTTQVLVIDPLKELSMALQKNFRQHPQELGCLFVKDDKYDETFYDSAVRKFGIEKVFQLIEEFSPLDDEWANTSYSNNTLPLFMVAASCDNCAAPVIYYFLRRNTHALF